MANYLLGALGILVSLGLFLLGYRQTVGAKKVRIAAANTELQRILLRRIVLERYVPKGMDISRVIQGKARDHGVQPAELLSESQTLNAVYTRIVESDLIPAEQRDEILGRITPALSAPEAAPAQEEAFEEVRSSERGVRATRAAVGLMALLASILGAVISVFPEIGHMQARLRELLSVIAGTAVASLAAIGLLYLVVRLRGSQEETASKAKELSRYYQFESTVRKILEKFGKVVASTGPDRGFDFIFERGGKKIAVEVKSWNRPVPPPILREVGNRLANAAERAGATEAILVTSTGTKQYSETLRENVGIKIMDLKELQSYVEQLPSP
jgi:hypothetical protein